MLIPLTRLYSWTIHQEVAIYWKSLYLQERVRKEYYVKFASLTWPITHQFLEFSWFLCLWQKKLGCSAAAWKFVSNGVNSILFTSSKQRGEVWRHVTMVALFLHDNKTKDDGRRLGEWQKRYVYIDIQQLCTCITLFCTFLYRRCTTTTWNFLISRARFME